MLFRRLVLALGLACVVAWPAIAVGPTGTIVGTVADPSEAVIPKAQITVRNQGTNATREVLTDDDGDFSVPLLPPGVYEVSAEKAGFRRSVYSDVNLNVDQTVRVDFVLQVGQLSEQVVVTESVPLVQTDTSTLGQVIERKQVSELPLNERNFLTFALLVPGGQLPVARLAEFHPGRRHQRQRSARAIKRFSARRRGQQRPVHQSIQRASVG